MATCINRSAPGYAELQEQFKSAAVTDNIIIGWQKANNSDKFPTVDQAKEFSKDQTALLALKRNEFGVALLNNLSRNGLISWSNKYQAYRVNTTIKGERGPAVEGNIDSQRANAVSILRYLRVNNIPQDIISFPEATYNKNGLMERLVLINQKAVSLKDTLSESRGFNTAHTPLLIEHLQRIFPQLSINVVGEREAKAYYESLPETANKKIKDFSRINSFYYNGEVYLIKGRVTNDIAVEEVLHPFVDAVKEDNPDLYNSLLEESKLNFPLLRQEITDAYREGKNAFPEQQLDNELLTQALARTFRNEFENEPTKSFMQKISELLEWLSGVVKDYYKFVTNKDLMFRPSDIKPGATMTDVAKLLNTEDIQFLTAVTERMSVKYALTPEKQQVVDSAKKIAVGTQKIIIDKLFHQSIESNNSIDDLTVTDDVTEGDDIVVHNKKDNRYYSIGTRKMFGSANQAIMGTENSDAKAKLDNQIRADKKIILNALTENKTFDQITEQFEVFDKEQLAQAYRDAQVALQSFLEEDAIAIPQVVLFDENVQMATTVDFLVVHTDGSIGIINLDISNVKRLESDSYQADRDAMNDDSMLVMQGITELSSRQQRNTEIQLAKRMLTNMGYKITDNPYNTVTIHLFAEMQDGKYSGNIEYDGNTKHAPSENEYYVNMIMPVNVDFASEKKLNDALKDEPYSYYDFDAYPDLDDVEFNDESTLENSLLFAEYDTLFDALKDYRRDLIEQKKAVEKIREHILVDKEKSDITENMEYAISMVSLAISSQDVGEANRILTQLTRDAIRETNNFIDYIEDPANQEKEEFISYVMNFKLFARSFRSLGQVAQNINLNTSQQNLINALAQRLTLATGDGDKRGLIDDAVDDYVKALVKRESAREFTQKDLDELIKTAKDIGLVQASTRSLLASEDTLLALMQKIFERNQSKAVDGLNEDSVVIRRAAQKLQKLDPGTDPQNLFEYMREFDEDGEPTGQYVREIGLQYDNMKEDLISAIRDEEGLPYVYKDIDPSSPTYQSDLAYNKDLYQKKQAFSDFMRAETIGANNQETSGEFHEYTEEFKKERSKFENFYPVGEHGIWKKKSTVSDDDYLIFKTKYYDTREYDKMVKKNGVPTGFIERGHTAYFVKQQYVKILPVSTSGRDMKSDKYNKMMEDTSALGEARREFYNIFVDYFENKYLKMIPPSSGASMIGSLPMIRAKFMDELSEKPNIAARMWSKTANGFKDFFSEGVYQKTVALDENGNVTDSLPVFFTGKAATKRDLARIEGQLAAIKDDYENKRITGDTYREMKLDLDAQAAAIQSRPLASELSGDLASSLLLFAGMAHNYYSLSQVEDTMKAMLNVIAEREYTPNDAYTNIKVFLSKGQSQKRGVKGGSRIEQRARHFMKAVFYDTDRQRIGVGEKMLNALMRLTSWSYVSFNATGNLNNFMMGKINNNIEFIGGRFIAREHILRATKEFNKQVLPSIVHNTSYYIEDAAKRKFGGNVYNPKKPATKYDAIVSYFRFMASMRELQEAGSGPAGNGSTEQSFLSKTLDMGYILNNGFEYALQSKTGVALVMSINVKNSKTGEVLSLYDAYEFNNQELKLKDGFDTVIDSKGNEKAYTDNFRYDLRTKAKSINQQIHGNYDYSTRTMMESHFIGRLAMQFHKWVAPAIRARGQAKYFDENLGWMEGRYRSLFVFIKYGLKQLAKGELSLSNFRKDFLEAQKNEVNFNAEQFAQNRLLNVNRTIGEIAIFTLLTGMKHLLLGLITEDEDDSIFRRRLENLILYQVDRSKKELAQFLPIPGTGGLTQMAQMWESPIAAFGGLGKLLIALDTTGKTGYYWLTRDSNGEFYSNSKVVYQNRPNRGKLKMNKKWKDVLPIIYSIQKIRSFDERKQYYVGTN